MFRSLLVVTLITAAHRMGEQMRGQAGLKKGEGVKVSGRLKSTGRKWGLIFCPLPQRNVSKVCLLQHTFGLAVNLNTVTNIL